MFPIWCCCLYSQISTANQKKKNDLHVQDLYARQLKPVSTVQIAYIFCIIPVSTSHTTCVFCPFNWSPNNKYWINGSSEQVVARVAFLLYPHPATIPNRCNPFNSLVKTTELQMRNNNCFIRHIWVKGPNINVFKFKKKNIGFTGHLSQTLNWKN